MRVWSRSKQASFSEGAGSPHFIIIIVSISFHSHTILSFLPSSDLPVKNESRDACLDFCRALDRVPCLILSFLVGDLLVARAVLVESGVESSALSFFNGLISSESLFGEPLGVCFRFLDTFTGESEVSRVSISLPVWLGDSSLFVPTSSLSVSSSRSDSNFASNSLGTLLPKLTWYLYCPSRSSRLAIGPRRWASPFLKTVPAALEGLAPSCFTESSWLEKSAITSTCWYTKHCYINCSNDCFQQIHM